ncbi:MAG TPA: ribonuclease D [Devosiaceae bacterium]|nr:ribonuclease D [Devosiaceae bacterium]
MQTITTTEALAAFCGRARRAGFVTVDTEFMRESTYWPILCLLQIATEYEAVLIDPIAGNMEFTALFALLADPKVVKVFHAAKQDIEIFVKMSGQAPTPVFDTQVAAAVCGFGDSVAYDALVREITGDHIDKSSRFTDWARRPLSERQLTYALADVTHLRPVYEFLGARLDELGRRGWVEDEMAGLTRPALYQTRPEDAWKRLKMKVSKPADLAVLQEVAAWRERRAQAQDVPRGRVIKDDAIYEIAQQQPLDADAFERLRSFSRGFGRSEAAAQIIDIVKQVRARDKDSLPEVPRRARGPSPKGAVGELIRVLLKSVAEENGVASRVIATSDEIDALVLDDDADVRPLDGWRRELFGDKALAIKHGRLALGANRAGVVPLEVDLSPK